MNEDAQDWKLLRGSADMGHGVIFFYDTLC